jgi:hypothetical protein
LGQRSRKRGRRERPASSPGVTTKPPRAAKASVPAHTPGRAKAPSRSEERNAAVRAALTPLAPGERPWPILVSVAIAAVLSVVNLGLFIGGAKPHVGGQQPHLGEILVFSGLMLMCAAGMWWMRYWAVLGFQTLLAIGLLGFCLALVRVSNILWGLVCLVVILTGGYLFFKLVRILSRIQMPRYPGR